MEPLLPGAPWLVAHRSMLNKDRPRRVTLNGRDYVLWQNRQGEISALNNVCPHMQAPLSEGWICAGRITCPFHALEFDGQGRMWQEGRSGAALARPLKIFVEDDCIWTYGGFAPQLPIPELHRHLARDYEFLGVAGETSLQADLLSSLLINYDFNHQNGTHREMFRVISCTVPSFVQSEYHAHVEMQLVRAANTPGELAKNPALALLPRQMSNTLEYAFPSTTVLIADVPFGRLAQVHIVYPETESRTRTFILLYGQIANPLLKRLLRKPLLEAAATVVAQDARAIESLYPREKPGVRLANDEIIAYAERLFREWPSAFAPVPADTLQCSDSPQGQGDCSNQQ
ncbi:MAG: Rieske 2Fe-2S domain-containing protein [Gemmatimonadaceae bacterium]|nr:Rieske 2Fe-2S domain-containing protein [Gloeobacterales cyanobacterium ES-bin-141]